jgi:hypothetical protein
LRIELPQPFTFVFAAAEKEQCNDLGRPKSCGGRARGGEPMMDNMTPGMMWGMGLFWLLVVTVLILAAAALIKYLRTGSKEDRQ